MTWSWICLTVSLVWVEVSASLCQDGPANCFCFNNERPKYLNFYCPDTQHTQLTITRKYSREATSTSLSCHHGFRDALDSQLFFNGSQFGESPVVKVRGCSPPATTFAHLLSRLGVDLTSVRALVVSRSQDVNRELQGGQLQGLHQLSHLGLANNGIKYINSSFFLQTPDIKILDLSANRGLHIEDGTFDNLKMLQELRLMSCDIEMIPGDMFQLPSLTDLNLNDNLLSSLPESLFSLVPRLSTLTLIKNKLRTLPEKIFRRLGSLREINLSFNQLEQLPSKLFEENKNLTEILLAFTALEKLPEGLLAGCGELKRLTISRSRLYNLPHTLLADATKLEYLDLSFNNISNLHHSFFEGLHDLKVLVLNSNKIKKLEKYLFYPTNLTKLMIRQNNLEEIDEDSFRKTHFLEEIDMSGNDLSSEDMEGFKANNLQKLRRLDLSHNQIDLIHMEFFLMSKLEILDLSHNSIGPVLRPEDINFKLTFGLTLDLSFNNIEHFDLADRFETVENDENFLLNISGNPIKCDCRATGLKLKLAGADSESLYEKSFRLTEDLIICADSSSSSGLVLQQLDWASMTCPVRSEDCPPVCSCQQNSYYREMIVNCSGQNLLKFPENVSLLPGMDSISLHLENNQLESLDDGNFGDYLQDVRRMYLSNNKIEKFSHFIIPTGLELLHLDHNKIEEIDKKELRLLESLIIRSNLTVRLSRNNLSCSCANKELYHFMINRGESVEGEFSSLLALLTSLSSLDASSVFLTCEGGAGHLPLAELEISSFCDVKNTQGTLSSDLPLPSNRHFSVVGGWIVSLRLPHHHRTVPPLPLL